jgi:hypothetical protein
MLSNYLSLIMLTVKNKSYKEILVFSSELGVLWANYKENAMQELDIVIEG